MRLVLVVLVCACSSSHHADVDAPAGGDAALDGTAAGCEIAANLGTVTNVAFVDAEAEPLEFVAVTKARRVPPRSLAVIV